MHAKCHGLKVLFVLQLAWALAQAQEQSPDLSALQLDLELSSEQHVSGGPIRAQVRLSSRSQRATRLELWWDRVGSFDGTLAGAVRLVVRDEAGKEQAIGAFGNFNRGPDRVHLEIPAKGALAGTVSSFLGHHLAKGNERQPLPPGKYVVYAVLGDELGAWYPTAPRSGCVRSQGLPLEVTPLRAKPRVADLAWLSGRWAGRLGDARFEETWSLPAAGSMLGTFRWMEGDRSRFYEFLLFEEDAEGVVLRFKHFSPGYRPWEKTTPIELRVEELTPERIVLTNISSGQTPMRVVYARQGKSGLQVTIDSRGEDGKLKTLELGFKKG